jgi:photosystem II stability/assembly factor-like uncharacterized protein
MAITPITPLPPAPSRSDGPVAFNTLADPFIAALPPFVLQANALGAAINEALISMGQGVSAAASSASAAAASASVANASKNAAAQSALDATSNGAAQVALAAAQVALAATQASLATTNGAAQVALAATQANLATTNGAAQVALAAAQVVLATGIKSATSTIKDQAQIIADAARAAVGIPSYALKGDYVFTVKPDGSGIEWQARHKIGEAILTARDMDASYLPLSGSTYLQSAYPLLFAEVGLIGAVSGDVWSQVLASGTVAPLSEVKRGKDGVLIGRILSNSLSQVLRSTDNGATWSVISYSAGATGGSSTTAAYSIATDGKGVWILTGFSGAASSYTISRSTDNGLTWTSVRNAATTDALFSACETDSNGTWIATGGTSSLVTIRSVDNGLTWTRPQNGVGSNSGYSVSCDKLGVWIIGSLGAAWRSTDNGLTWVSQSFPTGVMYAIANNGKGIWIMVGANSSTTPIYRSADNGLTWSVPNTGTGVETMRSLATDYAGNWFIGGSTGRMLRSTDEGQSWIIIPIATTGFISTDILYATIMVNSDVIVSGTVGSINTNKVRRSNGTYPYDSATMFKLPDLRAPQGLNYLIKAKEAA